MTYYRYSDPFLFDEYSYNNGLYLEEYEVIKSTPCGVWIRFPDRDKYLYDSLKYIQGKKFILEKSIWCKTTTKKRFAWATKHEALNSYIYRKQYQIGILENKLEDIKSFLKIAKKMQKDIT